MCYGVLCGGVQFPSVDTGVGIFMWRVGGSTAALALSLCVSRLVLVVCTHHRTRHTAFARSNRNDRCRWRCAAHRTHFVIQKQNQNQNHHSSNPNSFSSRYYYRSFAISCILFVLCFFSIYSLIKLSVAYWSAFAGVSSSSHKRMKCGKNRGNEAQLTAAWKIHTEQIKRATQKESVCFGVTKSVSVSMK